MDQTKPKVFLNRAEEIAYDREQRRRQEGETHGDILPLRRGEGGLEFAMPQWILDMWNSVTLPGDVAEGYEATPQDTTEFALNAGVGGVAASSVLKPDADLGMFVGPRAKLPREAYSAGERAAQLTSEGADPATVWKETGWWKGPDGNWRTEIDDSGFELSDEARGDLFIKQYSTLEGPDRVRHGKVEEDIIHPTLFDLYPDIFKVPENEYNLSTKMLDEGKPLSGGFYSPRGRASGTYSAEADDTGKIEDVILHELQHGVQNREGFARGANVQGIKNKFADIIYNLPPDGQDYVKTKGQIDQVLKQISKLSAEVNNPQGWGSTESKMTKFDTPTGPVYEYANPRRELEDNLQYLRRLQDDEKELEPLVKSYKKTLDKVIKVAERSGFDNYERVMGEAEARAVQARRHLTMDERRNLPPWESYDVPLEELMSDYHFDDLYQEVINLPERRIDD